METIRNVSCMILEETRTKRGRRSYKKGVVYGSACSASSLLPRSFHQNPKSINNKKSKIGNWKSKIHVKKVSSCLGDIAQRHVIKKRGRKEQKEKSGKPGRKYVGL